MKRKVLAIIAGIVVALMLIPLPFGLKDGGSIRFQAVLYSVTRVHQLNEAVVGGYQDGLIVEILGMRVYESYEE